MEERKSATQITTPTLKSVFVLERENKSVKENVKVIVHGAWTEEVMLLQAEFGVTTLVKPNDGRQDP